MDSGRRSGENSRVHRALLSTNAAARLFDSLSVRHERDLRGRVQRIERFAGGGSPAHRFNKRLHAAQLKCETRRFVVHGHGHARADTPGQRRGLTRVNRIHAAHRNEQRVHAAEGGDLRVAQIMAEIAQMQHARAVALDEKHDVRAALCAMRVVVRMMTGVSYFSLISNASFMKSTAS